MSLRPWTLNRRNATGGTTIAVKRPCERCRRPLGDVTSEEMAAAVAGLPLPSVEAECCCSTNNLPIGTRLSLDQPPGVDIHADPGSRAATPDPRAAAERILEFVREFGDGLVYGDGWWDPEGDEPPESMLWARDLEAAARAVIATHTPPTPTPATREQQ